MKKDLHKINNVIGNDVIILRTLWVVQKYTKQMQLIPLLVVISWSNFEQGYIMTRLFHIPNKIPKSALMSSDNDVILLKFERFCRKAFNFKRLYLSTLWMKHGKNW